MLLAAVMVLMFLPWAAQANAVAAGGTPDTTFTTKTGTGFNSFAYSVAVQTDGKIVVGGDFTTLNGATVNRIARLNADGTPDTAFTAAVKNTGNFTGFSSFVTSVAVQSDGKIVVGGSFTTLNGVTVNRVARLNADGTPDTAFTDAVKSTGTNTGFDNNTVFSVTLQTDGKIVVGGSFTTLNGVTVNLIARLNADGTPDTAFTDAVKSTGNNAGFDGAYVKSVAVQTDGKIVVSGQLFTLNGVTINHIARLDADSTLDTAFITNTGTGFNNVVYSVAVQTDGKMVIGGAFTTLNGATVNHLVRLDADGTPDTAFTTNTGTGFSGHVESVAVQTDGKIVVAGEFTTLNGVTANRIARLNADSANMSSDPSTWTTHYQSLPMPVSGVCAEITESQNISAGYNTNVSGGWTKSWEPWVNDNLDANGERIGGWACSRYLVNTGGNNWTSTPLQ
jgi:uncharacterized delta-60 repeat protein